jgi:hypothetical protein
VAAYLQSLRVDGVPESPFAYPGGGGSIWGTPLLVTPYAQNRLILLDAAQLIVYDAGAEVYASGQATIEQSDTPTTGAATEVSMFQANSVALKVRRYINWTVATTDAIAFVEIAAIAGSPS